MSDENGSLATNLLFFLLGAAAGAVAVALVTPKSGSYIRVDIKDLANKLKRKAREAGIALGSVRPSGDESEHGDPGD